MFELHWFVFIVGLCCAVFEYNKQFHNVLQVSRDEYRSCNGTSPITTHTSGNDSITIKRKGHYFFLCGVPGHCGLGQKVDIRVVNQTLSPVSSPSSSPTASPSTPSSSPSVPAGGPGGSSMNHASSKGLSFLGFATFAVASVLLMWDGDDSLCFARFAFFLFYRVREFPLYCMWWIGFNSQMELLKSFSSHLNFDDSVSFNRSFILWSDEHSTSKS